MKGFLARVGEKVRLRKWELLAYPAAAAAAAAFSLVPGRTLAFDDPACPNCDWAYEISEGEALEWCLSPGARDNCSFLYPNYEYARWATERICENELDLCFTCGNVYASGCCIWLEPDPGCCDLNHTECPYEAC